MDVYRRSTGSPMGFSHWSGDNGHVLQKRIHCCLPILRRIHRKRRAIGLETNRCIHSPQDGSRIAISTKPRPLPSSVEEGRLRTETDSSVHSLCQQSSCPTNWSVKLERLNS